MNVPINPNRALWEKGDFTRIAETMRKSGEALVQRLGISNGLKVLDLGCGDGTTAIPAAKLGAEVLGVDIASNLVAAGNKRANELGLANCQFQQGDAANLHQLPEQAFDLVVSIFGAMFAPKPFEVAKEAVRVTRPGGRIIMGNWIPNDPTLVAQILKISSAYTPPPPPGFVSPMTWGIESHVIERFAGREDLLCPGDVHFQLSLSSRGVRGSIPKILRADHECLRGRGEERSSGGFAERAGRTVQPAKPKPAKASHVDSRNLPASHGCALKGFAQNALKEGERHNASEIRDQELLTDPLAASPWC
jgi:SAM-dependent methyltransferase